jgi:Na+/H+-dicarboxylate symporter
MIQMARSDLSLKALSNSINRPSITFVAIAVALALGAMQLPFLQYLRPIGDFYIALLKICVLPFLLSTIPLAVRSAMASGSAGGTVRSLVIWVIITLVAVSIVTVAVTGLTFPRAGAAPLRPSKVPSRKAPSHAICQAVVSCSGTFPTGDGGGSSQPRGA